MDYWWKSAKPNELIFNKVKDLDNSQAYVQGANLRNMKLYGNQEFSGIAAYNYYRTETSYNVQNRVTLNIVQSMIDTVVSKITKTKPKPYFLTDEGDFSLQRKAQKLNKFVEGVFYATNFYDQSEMAYTDACIFGTGAIKIYRDGDEIKAERVFIDEIMIDDSEAYYGAPRQLHQRKWVHKDVLKQLFPGKSGAIDMAASSGTDRVNDARQINGDMILVIESWHLPSGKNAKDGKHVICINNETLFKEDYVKDYFPFVFFKWNLKPIGFWGQGIAEQLTGLQLEINKILRTIQVSMHLVSVPKIFVEASSKIVTAHLNNKIGGIVKYAGQPPIEGKLGSIPPELTTHLTYLYNRAYEIVGVSQLSSSSQKPAGLNSGKAMRVYNDLETERFLSNARRYEQVFLDAAKQFIDIAKEISNDTNNFEMKVAGSGFLKTIKWDDVQLDNDEYMMQIFPTSALSTTPAARLQEVQELLQAGFIGKEDGMKLLDFPDLKGFYNMANAGVEDIERQIELMVDKNEYQSPEPYQNLQYGIVKMQQAYLMYRAQNAPDETLELFRRWVEDAHTLVQNSQAAVAEQEQQALAVPQTPPTSDLLPNVPQG